MKYTAIILLFFCSAIGYGQATDGNIWQNGRIVAKDKGNAKVHIILSEEFDSLKKRVDFLTRDCIETHRRLDSLIAEWTIVPDYPAQWNYRDNIYHAGRNKGGVLLTDTAAIKKPRK